MPQLEITINSVQFMYGLICLNLGLECLGKLVSLSIVYIYIKIIFNSNLFCIKL